MDVPLSDEELQKRTIALGYPEFSAFRKADGLAKRVLALSRFDATKYEDHELDALLHTQGYVQKEVDTYFFGNAVFLSELLYNTKQLYRRNGITFDETTVTSDIDLYAPVPPGIEGRAFTDDAKDLDLQELAKISAEHMLQAVETRLYHITAYLDPRRKTPGIERFVSDEVKKMQAYASVGIENAEILLGYGLTAEAGMLKEAFTRLLQEDVVTKILSNNDLIIRDAILRAHAYLKNLPFNGDVWQFTEMTGEDISVTCELARSYQRNKAAASDIHSTEKKAVITTYDGIWNPRVSDKDVRKILSTKGGVGLAELMNQDDHLTTMLEQAKSPFVDLATILTAFNIPHIEAKHVEEYLLLNLTGRQFPEEKEVSWKEAIRSVRKKNKKYPAAIRRLVTEVTGIRGPTVAYQYFSDESEHIIAPGVGTILYGVDEDFILRQEGWHRQSPEDALATMQDYLPYDLYARVNIGACFMFGTDHLRSIFIPRFTLIDVRNDTDHLEDKFAADLLRLQVDTHEHVHAAQMNSRLAWRSYVAHIGTYMAEEALLQFQNGFLNKDVPFERVESLSTKGKKWKQVLRDLLDMYVVPALAKGKIGETVRQEGLLQGLLDAKKVPIVDNDINFKFLRDLPVEKSQATTFYNQVRWAIMHENVPALQRLIREGHALNEGMTSIVEHMAELYGLYAVKEYLADLKHEPEDKKKQYYGLLKEHIRRRGRVSKLYERIARDPVALEGHCMKYERVFTDGGTELHDRLVSLGYPPLDPREAYDNVVELRKRAAQKHMDLASVMVPMNRAKAYIGLRYSSEIPLFEQFIKQEGKKSAFKQLLEMESLAEVRAVVDAK